MFFDVTVPTLAPIFLIIALGWALHARRCLPEGFFTGLNLLTFYIGLPALLLVGIATSPVEAGPAMRIFYVITAATVVITIAAYALASCFRLPPTGSASFVQGAMRGNLAYIGLPVLFFALDGAAMGADELASMRAAAMLVLAPTVPLYNVASVLILEHGAGRSSGQHLSAWALTLKVLRNPLLLACLLGLALALTGIGLPLTVERTLRPLGQMALPLALLSIGASFTRGGLHRHAGPALAASLLKVAAAPLVGWGFALWFGLSPIESLMALIFLACPTAVASYVMAEQMGADAELAGGQIVMSTLLSMVALALILS